MERKTGPAGIGREIEPHEGRIFPAQSLPALFFGAHRRRLHRHRDTPQPTGGCSCGHPRHSSNYCKEFETAAGGGLGSKGSRAFERGLWRCRKIRSTTRGSVIKDMMRMRPPHGHKRGSASKILLINRAHVLRISREQSEMCGSQCFALGEAAFSSLSAAMQIRARFEYAPLSPPFWAFGRVSCARRSPTYKRTQC